ncbi:MULTISPECIES: ligase-associated DNA damage response endonuclease PdeM [Alphaproteobacteria]|uniref:Metallophosphatase n=2 Tax=Alphaproteobacteria TaxID=28211 RepID=A0A512HDJ6_9HYPH|nr:MULTISPECIES: ligase-associated DNA damage response endonuclease PdeM [Alphaproteobacteria]GEO83528.1 metallophosphatase [Ciceribacter naphthalenivorans]GLR24321.1 metallophosphatase [Ciceribacter naphthalenivorans]GLT07177.1 metallophosphatase [Sphingomonas psychrolutea]
MNRLSRLQDPSATHAQCSVRFIVHGVEAMADPSGALVLPDLQMVVVSDLHLEKGAAFARRGQFLPPYDTLATLKILEAVIARHDPKIVVSLGDNFHDPVGSVLMPEAFRDRIALMTAGREWIWINGNHDPDGTSNLPGLSVDELAYGGLIFRHEPSLAAGRGEVAGHLHPCATVRRREKSVRRPCFASDGTRLVMPAFGVLTGGLDLRHKAFTGFFDRSALVAHLLGRDRVYSVRFANLIG